MNKFTAIISECREGGGPKIGSADASTELENPDKSGAAAVSLIASRL